MALENAKELHLRQKEIVSKGLNNLETFIYRNKELRWSRPAGGTFCLVQLPQSACPASHYCDSLIERKELMILPASLFGFNDTLVRLCYGKSDLSICLNEWQDDINKYGWS
mmetsp:Transcript_2049/g.2365  ORF Transcript_2049/g.2365 Transcript_2049/m.2365 type:complete len:111 (+) Transcript_2049:69-401(+)